MRKIYVLFALLCVGISTLFITGCETNKNKIRVAEVTHSVFYAPQYVAMSEKIFEKNGLDVEVFLASGADKLMAALLSKDADIGLMGPEASIYV
jgi:NitT/TauT family transport system substrate-binding protein